ncbi:MAG: response regulator [Treponema sp.]|nr:response regulator [Treponema sp.]
MAAGVARVFMGSSLSLVVVVFFIGLSTLLTGYLANRFRFYHFGRMLIVVLLAFALFPAAFFVMGGVASAMPAYFVLSMVVIFLLAWGKTRILLVIFHTAAIVALYCFGSSPALARFFTAEQSNSITVSIQTILSVGFCIGFIVAFQKNIYLVEKNRADTALSALDSRSRLLETVNHVAEILLNIQADHKEILKNAMEVLSSCIGADRVIVWENKIKNGKLYYNVECRWGDRENASPELNDSYSYTESLPSWETKLRSGICINGPVKDASPEEYAVLSPFGIVSILVIPVFLEEKFWGFVSFDDCHRERCFSDDETSILRSGSLLLANAINRRQNGLTMEYQLEQQKLMSDISQNFISGISLEESINSAISRSGKFLMLDRVMLVVPDTELGESYPVFRWFSDEKWRPKERITGMAALIAGAFPSYMAVKGLIPIVRCDDLKTFGDDRYSQLEKEHVAAFIWVPIYVDNSFWGLLVLEQCQKIRIWNESDTQLAAMMSSTISGAISRDLMDKERTAAMDQALQASLAKGNFLSNMSHEMRTPMNAIIGMTSVGKNAKGSDKKDYAFEKIEDASAHLLGVINDILDMSKIEANKLELSPVPFNFEKMLQKVVNVINFRVNEKKQSFYVTFDKGIPRELIGDDQRLSQVITNLLSNAVKFTPEYGTIRLDAAMIESKQPGDIDVTIQINVNDTGIGISPDQQSRLFHSFEQAESSTTRKFGGTGLGLAISKRIVELMGGTIWIESALGKGSTFSFTAELKRGSKKQRMALMSGVNWSNVRVLAIDDEKEVRDYFADIAQRFNIKCDTASSGEEALRLIAENGAYDIYFVDWLMPGMNGLELTKKIKDDRSVVTMFSAASLSEIEDEARLAGVSAFLAKPIFPSDIADLINRYLGTGEIEKSDDEVHEIIEDNFEGSCALLVEDVEINREIVHALLGPTKLKIENAENGEEALQKFSEDQDRYDMILMDVQMPIMDGYEATKRIRALASEKAATIPIVAMTANVFREDIEKALAAGMNDHVGKPLDLPAVLEKLRKYLPGRQILS